MSKEINSNDSNSFPSNNGSNKSPNSNSSFSFGKYLKNPADIGIKKMKFGIKVIQKLIKIGTIINLGPFITVDLLTTLDTPLTLHPTKAKIIFLTLNLQIILVILLNMNILIKLEQLVNKN